jgi:D-alanine-D-alanine ligase
MSDEPPELRLPMPKKRVCVLQSSYEDSTSAFKGLDPYCNPMWYAPEDYEWDSVLLSKSTAVQQVRNLVQSRKYDVFFNLCDGSFDEDRAGIEVAQALERFNAPYTGADLRFYDPPKSLMKMMAFYCGVKTPNFVFAYNENDITTAANELRFPLIVKHYNGYSSIGMTVHSRCTTPEQLQLEARRFITEFGGALIEEFIEGREFTVLVSENPKDPENPIALLPIECVFSNGETFKHFDLKWKDFESIRWVPCKEEALAERLRDLSRKIFVALHGTGYGRTDIRVDSNGDAYFLEINPNCGIFYPTDSSQPDATQGGSADFILDHDPTMNHRQFVTHVIRCSELRHAAKRKSTAVQYRPSRGYGLYAERDISPGELVYAYEERNQPIVTRQYVEREWANDPVKLAGSTTMHGL